MTQILMCKHPWTAKIPVQLSHACANETLPASRSWHPSPRGTNLAHGPNGRHGGPKLSMIHMTYKQVEKRSRSVTLQIGNGMPCLSERRQLWLRQSFKLSATGGEWNDSGPVQRHPDIAGNRQFLQTVSGKHCFLQTVFKNRGNNKVTFLKVNT